jgi:hypothetical protein
VIAAPTKRDAGDGPPVPLEQESWGRVKARHRSQED